MQLVYNVGTNDAWYKVRTKNGLCPFYNRWVSMLQRCYDPVFHDRQPKYKDCSVCDEWLTFSVFRAWLEKQSYWTSLEIDKDLIYFGNKVYSPETCMLIPRKVNSFMVDRLGARGEYMIGVTIGRRGNGYKATYKQKYLGQYENENDAHLAWWNAKCQDAHRLADSLDNPVIAQALRKRYSGMSPYCK